MGARSSKVDILVNNNKVYITLPMFMVHGDRKKLRNQQLEYLEGLKWDEIIAGYNFRPALESFSDALRHWDYGELQANQFWAWKIEPYLFVIRPSSTVDEVAIDQSNAAIQFFIDFRTGVGYRRADNGNSISIAYDTKYRLSALRVAAPAAATPSATTTPTTSAAAPALAGYAPVPTGAVQGFDGVRGPVIPYLKHGAGSSAHTSAVSLSLTPACVDHHPCRNHGSNQQEEANRGWRRSGPGRSRAPCSAADLAFPQGVTPN